MSQTNNPQTSALTVTVIANSRDGDTRFMQQELPLTSRGGLHISERQGAANFRHRVSLPGYQSDWHAAGDPTLLVICRGQLKIILKDGQSRMFGPGDRFIAADQASVSGNLGERQGHRAVVVGNQPLEAVHIKLADFNVPQG